MKIIVIIYGDSVIYFEVSCIKLNVELEEEKIKLYNDLFI